MTAAVALVLAVALVILVYSYLLRPPSERASLANPEPPLTGEPAS